MEKRGTGYNQTTMQHIKRLDMLPPVQFSSDSIMDSADVDFGEEILVDDSFAPSIPPDPQHWLYLSHPASGLQIHLFAKESPLLVNCAPSRWILCLRNYPK